MSAENWGAIKTTLSRLAFIIPVASVRQALAKAG